MLVSHKIALAANNKQMTYFAKAAGVARFSYNWALARWTEQYQLGQKPSEISLRRELNSIKKEQFPWMLEVTKNAPQMAIIHLGNAFARFFQGLGNRPTFKKKGVHDSFSLTNDQFRVEEGRIRIPNLGWVRMAESLRFAGKIMSATISRTAGRWFVSITVESTSTPVASEKQAAVGVDLGVKDLAVLSTGEIVSGPKPHRNLLSRLRRLSRSLSRKGKASANRRKAKQRVAKLHARIANIRRDALHKLTTRLAKEFQTIVIEDLNVKGMLANRHLSRAISDMGFHEFRRQLAYKIERARGQLLVADRFFASSKLCSACGHLVDEMPLGVREWVCPSCGSEHNRDVNAARNLAALAEKSAEMAVSSTVAVCGEVGSGKGGRKTKLAKPPRRSRNQTADLGLPRFA